MTEILTEQKALLRKDYRQARKALGDEIRAQASLSICKQIEAWPLFQQALVILAYMPIKYEADLRRLLETHPEKTWVLPRIAPEENHSMYFHAYDPLRMVTHPFGMAEPDPGSPQITVGEIELTLTPGLAFDRWGWRLGYGGGYYDRFLKATSGESLGVTFDALLLDTLPHEPHDMPMGWLVSEKGLYRARS